MTVDDEIAEGDKVAVHWTVRGTHQADFLGIPPIRRQATWTGISIYRIENGKVAEERGVGDALGGCSNSVRSPHPDKRRLREAISGRAKEESLRGPPLSDAVAHSAVPLACH